VAFGVSKMLQSGVISASSTTLGKVISTSGSAIPYS